MTFASLLCYVTLWVTTILWIFQVRINIFSSFIHRSAVNLKAALRGRGKTDKGNLRENVNVDIKGIDNVMAPLLFRHILFCQKVIKHILYSLYLLEKEYIPKFKIQFFGGFCDCKKIVTHSTCQVNHVAYW